MSRTNNATAYAETIKKASSRGCEASATRFFPFYQYNTFINVNTIRSINANTIRLFGQQHGFI